MVPLDVGLESDCDVAQEDDAAQKGDAAQEGDAAQDVIETIFVLLADNVFMLLKMRR